MKIRTLGQLIDEFNDADDIEAKKLKNKIYFEAGEVLEFVKRLDP